MFSTEPRHIYRRNQLTDVICQLRFPEILTISANAPADFQEAIRDEFPQYMARQEMPAPKITGAPGAFRLDNPPATVNYQFTSADGVWRVNLTGKFISLACSCYTSWEDFAQKLDKPLAAFIQIYKPAFFERVGLRYVNIFSRKKLGLEATAFKDLFSPCYLGILAEEDILEGATSLCGVDTELAIRGGCHAKIHAGLGMVRRNGVRDTEVKFVFDQDLYMAGQLPLNLSTGALQTLHGQAWSIFRGAITDTLSDALDG